MKDNNEFSSTGEFDTQELSILAGEVADASEDNKGFVSAVMDDFQHDRLSLDGARRYLENRKTGS